MKFETKKQLLYDNDTFKNLTDYESKICNSQAIYYLFNNKLSINRQKQINMIKSTK